ncbi:LysR family transcriptional regulator [Pseudomonadota bacterium]
MTDQLTQFYYKKSRIQQLKGFCYTVQFGSVTKASEHMGLSTTAVTFQIQSLEEDLDIKLFERIGNRLVITKKGRAFYNLAIVQLQGIDSLFKIFHSGINKKNKNTLIIASGDDALTFILPKYVKKLTEQQQFKDIQIDVCNISRKEAFKRLIADEVDIAFYSSRKDSRNIPVEIKEEKIFKLKFALFLNKSHPLAKKSKITKEDVEKYECLLADKFTFYNPAESVSFKKSKIHFENGSSHIIMGFVKENVQMSGGNEVYKDAFSNIIFKNINHLLPEMFYSLFTLKNKKQKENVTYFINELRKDKEDV